MKGRYANMWRKQIRAERAAVAASRMVAEANALQKAVMDRPGSSGIEGGASEDVSENEVDPQYGATLASRAVTRTTEGGPEGDGESTMQGSQYSHAGDSDFDKSDNRSDDQDKPKDHHTPVGAQSDESVDTIQGPSKLSESSKGGSSTSS